MNTSTRRTTAALAVLALVALCVTGCRIDPEIAAIPEGALVVDVRTPREFGQRHFPGAVNLPLGKLATRTDRLGNKDRAIVVYCHSGHRSRDAKRMLVARGFTNVWNGAALDDMMKLAPAGKR